MATQQDVRRIALALPEVADSEFGFTVAGRGFVGLWRERLQPRRPKVPNPQMLAVPVVDLEERAALLAEDPDVFFTEPHYDGYAAVLVRLPEVTVARLAELLQDGWRCKAPKRLPR